MTGTRAPGAAATRLPSAMPARLPRPMKSWMAPMPLPSMPVVAVTIGPR